MKLHALIANTDHELSLELCDTAAQASVDGRPYEIEVHDFASGEYLLLNGPNVYRCRVDPKRDARNSFEVFLRGRSYDVTIVDPKRLGSSNDSGAHDHGSAEIVSPMPGKVVRILVEVGVHVEAGDGIVVVEAMKMQNELKSPKAGVVVSINAEPGATVNTEDVLAVIE